MGARRYEELEAWQLADQLKREVYALLANGAVARDFSFCQQLRESAASAPRNLAEGLARFRPTAFVPFVEIAIGSLMETRYTLQDGVDRGHFTTEHIAPVLTLTERAIQVSTKLVRYLKHTRRRP
jgi:four helix bundle protein